jgi:hypothetical protein
MIRERTLISDFLLCCKKGLNTGLSRDNPVNNPYFRSSGMAMVNQAAAKAYT